MVKLMGQIQVKPQLAAPFLVTLATHYPIFEFFQWFVGLIVLARVYFSCTSNKQQSGVLNRLIHHL